MKADLRISIKNDSSGQSRRALTSPEKAVAEKLVAEHDASGTMTLYEKFLKLNPSVSFSGA